MMHDNLSLVTCNYDTPHIITTMLRSWVSVNSNVSNKTYIVDNSNNEESAKLLHNDKIPFVRNPGGKHYEGVQIILDNVQTRYVLLVDTDVLFNKNIGQIFEEFVAGGYAIMGEVCGDRGGFSLHDRIHPWFCFIDVEQIRSKNIKFVNWDKINSTNSNGFYYNNPLNANDGLRKYDVGATFLEDIVSAGLTYKNIKLDPEYYYHFEGMSWRGASGVPNLVHANNQNEMRYRGYYNTLSRVRLGSFF